ncbi:MAG: ROK family protein [Actinomycetota bacterium]
MRGAVGVDVGGSFVKAVRLDEGGAATERDIRATPRRWDGIMRTVSALASSLGAGLPLGVGLAGLVDHHRGVLVWAPHLPGQEVDVQDSLEQRLGVGVAVDNDANLAALAEHRLGAARGASSALTLTLGTGIGLGVILEGRIYRGRAHAGEVGHVTVEPDGEECACGRRGCWETKVSGARLDSVAAALLGEGQVAADMVSAARAGDSPAVRAMEEAGEWLGRGIEALALAFDPEIIVVGGAAAAGGDLLLEPVRRHLSGTEGAGWRRLPDVAAGSLGPDAGAIGAALMAGEKSNG